MSQASFTSVTSCSSPDSPLAIEISEPSSPGLPPENMTFETDIDLGKLKIDLEHCLDLRSVMKGKKLIKADVR